MKDEILNYILDNTKKEVFDLMLDNHNIHALYRAKKNYLLYKYFNGHELHYSIFMSKLFNEFITEGQQIVATQLQYELRVLKGNVKSAKKYGSPYEHLMKEYNDKVDRYNELMKGVDRLIALWNKRHKKLKQVA